MITTYDQSFGLIPLINRAVGPENLGNINPDITPGRFRFPVTGVRTVDLRVEPGIDELGEQAVLRPTAAGRKLASTGDLAGFLYDHPEEVEKWDWVLAISADSRWARPVGISVPSSDMYGVRARVRGADRYFDLFGPLSVCRINSRYGILVVSE